MNEKGSIIDGLSTFIEESLMLYVLIGIVYIGVIMPLLINAFTGTENDTVSILLISLIPLLFIIGLVKRSLDSMKEKAQQYYGPQ